MPAGQDSRPWWSYARFSVRGLVALVVLIGGGLGWLVRSARDQRDAVAAIQKARGRVSYEWQWNDGRSTPNGEPLWPRWLVNRVGVDFFGHVSSVELGHGTDAALVYVGYLTQLEKLDLRGSSGH